MRYQVRDELRPALLGGIVLLAQVVAVTAGPVVAGIAYAAALLICLELAITTALPSTRALLLSVAIIPLVQLSALVVPGSDLDPALRYLGITLLGLVAVLVVAHVTRMRARELGLRLRLRDAALTLAMSPGCVSLGLLTAELVRPVPLLTFSEPNRVLVPGMALAIGALVEAVLFRGLLQTYAVRVLGPWKGVAYASVLFAAVSVLFPSPSVLLLALSASVMFGCATLATGSIVPAAVGQLLFNVSLFIVDPFQGR
jgi:membrane protease YdiL (CAAX protease family)